MKTKTLQSYKNHCTYNGKLVLEASGCDIGKIEVWARQNGFTHVKWHNLPIGSGSPRCKIN